VTDKTASEAITRFGLERRLDKWKRPSEIFRKLKQKTRERDQLVGESTNEPLLFTGWHKAALVQN
ncbi:MAG TPA: hypothetical protein VEW65_06990, partial [Chryseolinea sp.]|nr:hypothetical protein [Chryseolinea sp.]